MLNELLAAQDTGNSLNRFDLLDVANERYGCGWSSRTQINFRRGWLQSAGLISATGDTKLEVTPAGRDLVNRLELHEPPPPIARPAPLEAAQSPGVGRPPINVIEINRSTG